MSRRYLGIAMFLVGLLIILVSLFADVIGIGANLYVFGWKQILGICIGELISIVGIVISRQK